MKGIHNVDIVIRKFSVPDNVRVRNKRNTYSTIFTVLTWISCLTSREGAKGGFEGQGVNAGTRREGNGAFENT